MLKKKFVLGLVLAAIAMTAAAAKLPPPRQIYGYYQDGVQVGWAVNDCQGNITVHGVTTGDVRFLGEVDCSQ
jgi:hypothetical protein